MTTTTPEENTNAMNSKKRPVPDDSDSEKLAARREANRIHALKSRQRSKALMQELQRTVSHLSGEKADLERQNAVLRAQIEVLQQQNIALTQSQRMLLMRTGQMTPEAAAMNAAFPGLFGLSQAAGLTGASTPGTSNNGTITTAATGAASTASGTDTTHAVPGDQSNAMAAAGLQLQQLMGLAGSATGATISNPPNATTTPTPQAAETTTVGGQEAKPAPDAAEQVVA
jgi:hypothetical protein